MSKERSGFAYIVRRLSCRCIAAIISDDKASAADVERYLASGFCVERHRTQDAIDLFCDATAQLQDCQSCELARTLEVLAGGA